ncbi:MAG: RluA family pseudouridine synthase [Verrucomicrobia bacterium]|nr:RluA family pseudouridine synthase [Verrucomicrobiota bacterium]
MQLTEEKFFLVKEEAGLRLDQVLALRFPKRSRSYFQYLFENKRVILKNSTAKKGEKGKAGDLVKVFFEDTPPSLLEPQDIPFTVLYEDEYFLAINKPRGLVVHPGNGNRDKTLVNGLLFKYPDLPDMAGAMRPGIVHRLDKETSGILLAVKTKEAHAAFVRLFQDRAIEKAYFAICQGKPKEGVFSAPIVRHKVDRKRMTIALEEGVGKEAVTEFEVVSHFEGKSLVIARPKTGRTHQIRVHLKTLHSPVLGDTIYHSKGEKAERLFLHAYSLLFTHPFTKEKLFLKADLPEEFLIKLKKINL